jgi:hypothetical protein
VILPERISLPIRRIPAVFAIGGPHGSTEFRAPRVGLAGPAI